MNTQFFWAWNQYAPLPDNSMTRERAARLLWAWRRTSRKPTSMGRMLRSLRRVSAGIYRVVDLQSGEMGTMIIMKVEVARIADPQKTLGESVAQIEQLEADLRAAQFVNRYERAFPRDPE